MILKEIKYRNFKAKIVKLTRKQAKYGNMYGCYFPDTQTIAIQEKLSNYTLLDTMLHEIGHFIADKSKIRLKNLGEEGITTFVGSEFAKVFMQNPKLITFIKRCTAK
jgi:Zn-dependent peptidase ImmA (M78 family)